MMWLVGLVAIAMTVLAGSPWLLAHRAQRRRHLHFVKRRRTRLRSR